MSNGTALIVLFTFTAVVSVTACGGILLSEKKTPRGQFLIMGHSRSSKWNTVRRLAWGRDRKNRPPCHICGQPIDYSIPPSSSPLAWEPDHVVPFSIAPELELDLNNIKASHRQCNRARGKDGRINELGMRSRVW